MNPTSQMPRLTLDRLEDPAVPTTVTTALVGGVLRVTGTSANDTILIRQTAAHNVTVSFGSTTRSFTGVNEIYADGQSGNDYIYFDTSPLGANQATQSLKTT